MVLRGTDVEFRVAGIAVVLIGIGVLPIIVAKMRLGKGYEHPHVVRCPENLSKAPRRTRLTAVVVSIYEVDSKTFETLHTLPRSLVGRQGGGNLGVIKRHGGEKDAAAIQVEITSVDPELAEAEPHRKGRVQHLAACVEQRYGCLVLVFRRVDVPELSRLPFFGERHSAIPDVARAEPPARRARELPGASAPLA